MNEYKKNKKLITKNIGFENFLINLKVDLVNLYISGDDTTNYKLILKLMVSLI